MQINNPTSIVVNVNVGYLLIIYYILVGLFLSNILFVFFLIFVTVI